MAKAGTRDSTPRKTAFKIIAGTDFVPTLSEPDATAPSPAQGKRKKRGAYQGERRQVEYQDGLPVIDPAGEEDFIFRHIAAHRRAIDHYDRCVTVESEAEDKVSASEYAFIQHNARNAYHEMICHAKGIILSRPTTRRGLIHQARYLAAQFDKDVGYDEGAKQLMYLPDEINDRPWVAAFLKSLAAGLRKMAGELDSPNEGGQQ
jgi:hypothetical protein